MATFETRTIYIPRDLIGPIAKCLVAQQISFSQLVQQALREKFERDQSLVSVGTGNGCQ